MSEQINQESNQEAEKVKSQEESVIWKLPSVREPFKDNKMPIMPPNLLDYFPETKGDGLQITWAHGVNSKQKLASALRGPHMMLEADVSMSGNSRYPVPIMAHPPAMTSDLTLEEWLIEVLRHNGKGIKLDFKSTEVVEPACRVLVKVAEQFRGPVILNADILPGPNNPVTSPVDAWTFLTLGRTRFPKAIISIGWTTEYMPCMTNNGIKFGYAREMTDRMVSLVKEYSLLQPVTFPVSAPHLKYSIPEMQRLLFQVPNSSLTVWSNKTHPVSLEELICIRKSFGVSQIFYDLPDDLMELFYSVI